MTRRRRRLRRLCKMLSELQWSDLKNCFLGARNVAQINNARSTMVALTLI
jgi:hypothetical protein